MIKKFLSKYLGEDFMRLQLREKIVWIWLVVSFCLLLAVDYNHTSFVSSLCVILNFGISATVAKKVLPKNWGKEDNEL